MEAVTLKFNGETAVVVKGVGPVAPGDQRTVSAAAAANLLRDSRWKKVNQKTAAKAKEETHGAE